MKLVSPKTLLASLLGCAFVVIKVMRFDGFPKDWSQRFRRRPMTRMLNRRNTGKCSTVICLVDLRISHRIFRSS